jgi:hypothetical protein
MQLTSLVEKGGFYVEWREFFLENPDQLNLESRGVLSQIDPLRQRPI